MITFVTSSLVTLPTTMQGYRTKKKRQKKQDLASYANKTPEGWGIKLNGKYRRDARKVDRQDLSEKERHSWPGWWCVVWAWERGWRGVHLDLSTKVRHSYFG
jgi:hypothetical protein